MNDSVVFLILTCVGHIVVRDCTVTNSILLKTL